MGWKGPLEIISGQRSDLQYLWLPLIKSIGFRIMYFKMEAIINFLAIGGCFAIMTEPFEDFSCAL